MAYDQANAPGGDYAPGQITVRILSGASLSEAAVIGGKKLLLLRLPTIDSAVVTFASSPDGVLAYNPLYGADGVEVTIATASTGARDMAVPLEVLSVPFLKIRLGTVGTPVNQNANRDIILYTS